MPEIRAPEAGPAPDPLPERVPGLTPAQKESLLRLARETLTRLVTGREAPTPDWATLDPPLTEPRACFVTLTRKEALRGCVGHLQPKEPLWRAVMDNTRHAAQFDPRFPPVAPAELAEIRIEISVLSVLHLLERGSPEELLGKLRPGMDGIVLERGSLRSTFLPQVWEDLPDKTVFLERLCRKGGWEPDAWRDPAMAVLTYQVEAFHESGASSGLGAT
jgi:AmmeMemoRadiSam system protein A